MNVLGFKHHSNSYFAWANAVVEKALQQRPDKLFGCLAYRELTEPPDNGVVHPRLVAISLQGNSTHGSHPNAGARGTGSLRRWSKAAPQLGWWDYAWGGHYLVPRVWFRRMARRYRYLLQHNVRHIVTGAGVAGTFYKDFGLRSGPRGGRTGTKAPSST